MPSVLIAKKQACAFGVVFTHWSGFEPHRRGAMVGSAGAVLLCGRYEGVDQRFIDQHVDQQISLGDFVLSGGEIAAMALLDAVARLQPGVLNDEGSHQLDSFNPALDGLLDSPHYTRPEVWQGHAVPPELMSGHHAHIERWRREQSLSLTALHRPELIDQARAAGNLSRQDETLLKQREPARSVRSANRLRKSYNQGLFDPLPAAIWFSHAWAWPLQHRTPLV
jgi:tRNA G37 N-methylase TrmD